MERATPISHLQRSGEQDNDASQMMDSIVNELEEEDQQYEQHPGPQHQQVHHQGPPQQQQQPPRGFHHGPMQPGQMQNGPMYPQQQQQHFQGNRGPQPSLENPSMMQRILGEMKEPLLVSVLVIIMSSPQIQTLIAKFLPIAQSNPLIGLGVRAVFAGVIFWLLRRFIPTSN